jgi:hypothetical protein
MKDAVLLLSDGTRVVVDADDAPVVSRHRWHRGVSRSTAYAYTNVRALTNSGQIQTLLGMHRLILGLGYGDPQKVDHIDGDGLNNRRSNLRIATNKTNRWNSAAVNGARSPYKGVNWQQFKGKNGKWRAQISVDGKQRHLGLFKTEIEAAVAYDEAALELHGPFARLNILRDPA